MYSFEINIGSLSAPVLGSGWLAVTPVYRSGAFDKSVEDLVRVRTKISGNFTFLGAEFTAINSLDTLQIPFRIKVKGTVRFTGYLSRQGKYNSKGKKATLTVQPDDQYVKILQNIDAELDLSGRFYHNVTQDYVSEIYLLGAGIAAGGAGPVTTPDEYSVCGSEIPAAWD